LIALVGRKAPSVPVARAEYELVRISTPGQGEEAPAETLRDLSVLAFCGLGNPAGFEATLTRAGARVAELAAFPDHYAYTQADLARLEARRKELGLAAIVCTEKDAVKLAGLELPASLWVARAELTLGLGASLLATRLTLLLDDVIR
jgi:tetraacyldisaccharide 4'-kinase